MGLRVRFEPVGVEHRDLAVVDDHGGGDPAKILEGVFDAANERLGVLPPHDLAVGLARVAEHGAKQVRSAALAGLVDDGRTLPEVDLHLFAGLSLHATERQRQG